MRTIEWMGAPYEEHLNPRLTDAYPRLFWRYAVLDVRPGYPLITREQPRQLLRARLIARS